jgi:hypothetical protein
MTMSATGARDDHAPTPRVVARTLQMVVVEEQWPI